ATAYSTIVVRAAPGVAMGLPSPVATPQGVSAAGSLPIVMNPLPMNPVPSASSSHAGGPAATGNPVPLSDALTATLSLPPGEGTGGVAQPPATAPRPRPALATPAPNAVSPEDPTNDIGPLSPIGTGGDGSAGGSGFTYGVSGEVPIAAIKDRSFSGSV